MNDGSLESRHTRSDLRVERAEKIGFLSSYFFFFYLITKAVSRFRNIVILKIRRREKYKGTILHKKYDTKRVCVATLCLIMSLVAKDILNITQCV
jgi:hypothetical protein